MNMHYFPKIVRNMSTRSQDISTLVGVGGTLSNK